MGWEPLPGDLIAELVEPGSGGADGLCSKWGE